MNLRLLLKFWITSVSFNQLNYDEDSDYDYFWIEYSVVIHMTDMQCHTYFQRAIVITNRLRMKKHFLESILRI